MKAEQIPINFEDVNQRFNSLIEELLHDENWLHSLVFDFYTSKYKKSPAPPSRLISEVVLTAWKEKGYYQDEVKYKLMRIKDEPSYKELFKKVFAVIGEINKSQQSSKTKNAKSAMNVKRPKNSFVTDSMIRDASWRAIREDHEKINE